MLRKFFPLRMGNIRKNATDAIQKAIDAAHESGGGIVKIPPGVHQIGGLIARSRVILEGHGEAASCLRLEDGCDTHVIQTEAFDEKAAAGKQWLVKEGMPHGMGFRAFRIDGNRDGNKRGTGLCVYAKRYLLHDVLITDCAEHGMISQGPDIGGQEEVDDILEAVIGLVRIHRCGTGGLIYRGPHDGEIESAIIGSCGGIGFLSDTKSGSFNGAVDIGRLHTYGCIVGTQINTAGTAVGRLIGDANFRQGAIVNAHRVQIGQLWAFRNWRTDRPGSTRSEDPRLDASVELNQACQIGTATVRTDFGGTGIRVKGARTQISSCQIENESPRTGPLPGIGLDIQANRVRVSGDIQGYSQSESIGARISGEKYLMMTDLRLSIADCDTGFVNECSGDSHHWDVSVQVAEGQRGFRNEGKITRSDVSIRPRNADWKSWHAHSKVS